MNNIEQVDRETIERDGFAITGGSIGITKRSTSEEIKRWLDNMTTEQLATHKQNEQDLQKRKANDYHY